MKKNKLLFGILKTVLILYVIALFVVTLTNARRSEFVQHWYFYNNLERINLAIVLHAKEHNGKMPSASTWADLIKEQNQLILEEDFVTPMSYSSFGLYYNKSLENKSLSNLKKDTIVLFTAKGEWNANGDMSVFREKSVNKKPSIVITLKGDIYRYYSDDDSFVRLKDSQTVNSDGLNWE